MSGSNRVLAMLLGVLAVLVLVVGGLSAVLLLSGEGGGDDGASASNGRSGVTTSSSDDGGSGGGGSEGAASGRLRIASGDPVTLDPHLATDALSAEYIVEIYGGLVTLDLNLEVVGDIAEKWGVTSNPPLVVIHGNQVDAVPRAYVRYLENTYRRVLKLGGALQIPAQPGTCMVLPLPTAEPAGEE